MFKSSFNILFCCSGAELLSWFEMKIKKNGCFFINITAKSARQKCTVTPNYLTIESVWSKAPQTFWNATQKKKEKKRKSGVLSAGRRWGELAYLQIDSKAVRRRVSVSGKGFGHHNSWSIQKTMFPRSRCESLTRLPIHPGEEFKSKRKGGKGGFLFLSCEEVCQARSSADGTLCLKLKQINASKKKKQKKKHYWQ